MNRRNQANSPKRLNQHINKQLRSLTLASCVCLISLAGVFSAYLAVHPTAAKALQVPSNLVAWDSGKYVQLNWDADFGRTGQGYNVYRSLKTADSWEKLNETPFSATTFVDYSAPRSEAVFYRINFINESGEDIPNGPIAEISTSTASALTQPEALLAYDKNNIITDSQLTNVGTMSAAQIQSFLTSQGSVLASYSSGGKTAAQRIYDDCQTHGINPYVVLVTLQKEKGLIRSSTANPNSLAMGWNTGDSSTSDFANQIYYGTRQFKLYYNNLGNYGWTVGQPHAVSDGTVTAANTSTAGLYIYTPWIGQGGGGQMGGNYLFWDIWYNTFSFGGSAATTAAFPPTVITTKFSTSPYATSQNAFWVSDHSLAGQCTWYAYGRVIELSAAGYLDPSAATIMYNAFWVQ